MIKFFLLNLSLMISSIMMIIKTPLNLGLLILIQTLLYSLFMNINTNIYWISYILYLIMLGGILILFMYMCLMSSNEIIKFNINWTIFYFFAIFSVVTLNYKTLFWLNSLNSKFYNNLLINKESILNISKIYNNLCMMITILLIIYLLISLMMVSMFTNMNYGPLRSTK